jgi:hypothetical protein
MTVRGLVSSKKLWLACAALAVVAAIGIATIPDSDAVVVVGPGVWAYYSNATYTTVVGARGTGCCGAPISWGVTTPYKRFHRIYCLDVVCPN